MLDGRLWTCGALGSVAVSCRNSYSPHELACLVLRARGPSREAFIIVWKYFPLARLDAAFGASCVCRCEEAFSLGVGGRCEWLIPDRTITPPIGVVRVENYRQFGL